MTAGAAILLADDDNVTRRVLTVVLESAGYNVHAVESAESALERFQTVAVDVVVSDINMPGLSGLDLLAYVRRQQLDCEVVLVTGAASVDTAVQALRDGAFDYLTKPVSKDLLTGSVARAFAKITEARRKRQAMALVESGLRQMRGDGASAPPGKSAAVQPPAAGDQRQFRLGDVLLDLDRFTIEVGGIPIEATPSEVELLSYFCQNPDRALSPQELVRALRGYAVEAAEAAELIRPHVSNLRRKLLAASPSADIIATVRSVGYILRATQA